MAKKKPSSKKDDLNLQRLQRFLAAAGIGSRRECEELIAEGRVEVDGEIVTEMGVKVDPDTQKIRIDGQWVKAPRLAYYMLNKPPGVVSTAADPAGRIRVVDLIKTNQRVYNVGRLDKSSEGLILVTNDGDLANKLTHPRYGVVKKYMVLVKGRPDKATLEQMQRGVYLAEAKVRVANVRIKKTQKDSCWLEIVLDEGRNREIRRILAKLGHKVTRLRRVAIGPLNIGDLPLGAHRRLTHEEVNRLKRASSGTRGRRRFTKKKTTSSAKSSTAGSDTAKKRATKKNSRKKSSKSRGASASRKRSDPRASKGRSGARAKRNSKSNRGRR